MFELRHITSRTRTFLQRSFPLLFGDFDVYAICNSCPMSNWNWASFVLQPCSLCPAESFPIVFWLVVVFSLLGATFNCYELLQVWSCPGKKLAVWRQRHFYVLDHWALRKARLLSSGTIMIAWLMLIYGVLAISPHAMSPWILLTSLVLSLECFMWSFEVITGRLPICLQTLLSLALHVFFLSMVCCVKSVFEVALGQHFAEGMGGPANVIIN